MIECAPILDRDKYDRNATETDLEKTVPFDRRYMAARSLVWTVIKGCIGTNNNLNLQLKKFNKTTDGRSAYFSIESFMLGNDHSSSLITDAEVGLRDTTYTSNIKNWKIEDYISKHIEFHSPLDYQYTLGTYKGMFEYQKVDRLLDGLKSHYFIGLKSNILCNQRMRNDFNATAAHIKDTVNRTPQINNPPDPQVSAMGRGGVRGSGTDRGGRDGRAGRGGQRYDSGRRHRGRGNDRDRRGDCSPSSHNYRPDKCTHQDTVDRAKPDIVNRYVTGNRIFVGDHVYNSEMTAVERHAVYQIRAELKANKDPLGKVGRKHTSKVAALQRTVEELSARVGHYPGNHTEYDHDCGQCQYPDKTDSRSNKNQPGLVRQYYSDKKQKGLGD